MSAFDASASRVIYPGINTASRVPSDLECAYIQMQHTLLLVRTAPTLCSRHSPKPFATSAGFVLLPNFYIPRSTRSACISDKPSARFKIAC